MQHWSNDSMHTNEYSLVEPYEGQWMAHNIVKKVYFHIKYAFLLWQKYLWDNSMGECHQKLLVNTF